MASIKPISFREAKDFVNAHHRHNVAPQGHKFSIGLVDELGALVGVAMVGRPVARMLDDAFTAEVTRTCTLGASNANSQLYGACWRAAKGMGYRRLVTYTQFDESGASLKAAGFVRTASVGEGSWSRASRDRADKHDTTITRQRWEINAHATSK